MYDVQVTATDDSDSSNTVVQEVGIKVAALVVVAATENDDTIYGGEGDDTIYAGTGDDTIDGGAGDDDLDGGLGNDTFKASMGTDTIVAGGGIDTLTFQNGQYVETIQYVNADNGDFNDDLEFTFATGLDASGSHTPGDVTYSITGGADEELFEVNASKSTTA